MTHMFYVVTQTFVKRAWWGAFLGVSLLVLGPLALRGLILLVEGPIESGAFRPFSFHFAFLATSWLVFISVCLQALQGVKKFIFGLPLPSASIASGLMFITIGTVIILSLITNGLYRLVFFDENWLSDYWPVLGPTLFIATLMMVGHCAYWNLHARGFGRLLFWIGLIVAMFWWFISRYYPHGFSEKIVPWSNVTLSEFVILQLVFVVAWVYGIVSFARVRSSTAEPSLHWNRFESWLNQLSSGALNETDDIPVSKSSALAQLHWRDSCRRAILLVLFLGSIALILNLVQFTYYNTLGMENQTANESPMVVTMMFLFFSAISLFLILGEALSTRNMVEMKGYLAIAPLSDQDFSAVLVRNLIKCVVLTVIVIALLSFLVSYFIAALYYGLDLVSSNWNWFVNHDSKVLFIALPVLVLVGFWAGIANTLSLFWTGHQRFTAGVLFTFFGLLFSGFIAGIVLIPESMKTGFLHGSFLLLTFCIWSGTIIAYLNAHRKELINSTTIWAAVVFCLLMPLVFWGFWKTDQNIVRLFLSSVLVLAITPFATIPLAVSWNRHR
ncbi:hypothetical protein [Gimesia aquarii]|uniref:Uncharacterized protein n=1 Tax=Gimesia aquarii TaxID=2527964 RepID=A0A517WPG3_9PLAN|nr:hypothetical protein [Gimesia aquarii]QDU07136.1 hypothetical protein V202x_04860 [Gimesia aquarii]